jgi:hypothetical protein
MTVRNRILRAFNQLRKDGFFAEPDWTCCQTCGVAELPDGVEDYVFFHMQDAECLRETGDCYLSYGGDARHIVRRLKEAGLTVEWNGSESTRIRVAGPQLH